MKRPVRHRLASALNRLRFAIVPIRRTGKSAFECPVCHYEGPFRDHRPDTGLRRDALCPRCGALERHRLQQLVIDRVFSERPAATLRMLHVAPEPFFRERFREMFGRYETADIERSDVDHRVDLQSLPFADAAYDVVYASHVLEHVPDDAAALAEIRRVLAPGGIAILPVPIVCDATVEYPAPNPAEAMHVRAPGLDYFDRYRKAFRRVDVHASGDFPARHQVHILESRTDYPRSDSPHRTPMAGESHADFVPVCHA